MLCPNTSTLVLIWPTSKGWQTESTTTGVNSVANRAQTQDPKMPSQSHPNHKANNRLEATWGVCKKTWRTDVKSMRTKILWSDETKIELRPECKALNLAETKHSSSPIEDHPHREAWWWCSRSNLTKQICKEEWEKIPKSRCARLIHTYPRRPEGVIAAKITTTKYWLRGLNT